MNKTLNIFRTMKNLSFISLLLFLAFAANAQDMGNSGYNRNEYRTTRNNTNTTFANDSTMEIGVKAIMNVKADSYVAMFGIAQFGETIDVCNMLINSRISNFSDSLVKMGIKKSDIYLDMISQVPVYDYTVDKKLFSRTFNEIPKGFNINKNIHISIENHDLMSKIMTVAARLEIYDLIKVEYIVNRQQAIFDTLRTLSALQLNKKMSTYKTLGLTFKSKYHIVSENITSYYPSERYYTYAAYNNTNLYLSKKIFSSTEVNNVAKQTTYYYNKLSFNDFDIVINPNILEPEVQFVYQLKMQYSLNKTKE